MIQVISLDDADAVFARDRAFHLHRPLDHPVDQVVGHMPFLLVEK